MTIIIAINFLTGQIGQFLKCIRAFMAKGFAIDYSKHKCCRDNKDEHLSRTLSSKMLTVSLSSRIFLSWRGS